MEKERKRISLATYIISLLIMVFIIVVIICMLSKGDTKQYNMGNIVNDIVQESTNKIISNIKYIEVQIEDTDAQGLKHKEPVRIDDKNVISKLEEIVNSGTEYEPRSTAWPDISPMVTFYLENGDEYVGYTATFISSLEEDEGNYITIFNKKDENTTKVTYKVKDNLDKYLVDIYNKSEDEKYIVLYNGIEIEPKMSVQFIDDCMDNANENRERYNRKYYNYENGRYVGETEGIFGEEYVYDEKTSYVDKVGEIAISKKYDAVPRTYMTTNKLPKELNEFMDCSSVELQSIDLDGDGKKEHILCYTVNYPSGEMGNREPQASSEIILLDSNYKKICTLVNLEDGFWADIKDDKHTIFLSLDDVDYIDIDNDGIMEILCKIPKYEFYSLSIVKYNNGDVEGDVEIKASLDP